MVPVVLDRDRDLDAVVRRCAGEHRLAVGGLADHRVPFGVDHGPHRAKRCELQQRQAIVELVHRGGRAAPFLRFVPRVLVREDANLVQRLAVGFGPLQNRARRRQVIRHLELGVRQPGHARPVRHRPVDPELHADDALDRHHLPATHADRFGDLAHVLADARARDLVRGEPVVVLREHGVVALRAISVRRTYLLRLLCKQCGAGDQDGDARSNQYSHGAGVRSCRLQADFDHHRRNGSASS